MTDDKEKQQTAAEQFYLQFVWDANVPQEHIDWQRKCDVTAFLAGIAWRDQNPSREVLVKAINMFMSENKNIDDIMEELSKEQGG